MKTSFKTIEKRWQTEWEKKRIFEISRKSSTKKEKYYILEMFPYPSGSGLHMGHALNFTIGDIFARYKRMKGFNVLHPMGYDALGLPAENAAIKVGEHPKNYTKKSIRYFTKQMKELGFSYGWSRMVSTTDPEYYRWDQWIFLKMFEKGLAYRKKAPVNWCSKCKTVLANEQVVNGKCWRHEDTDVEIRYLEQWFFKITKYADELYNETDKLDWPMRTKAMQKNWIGKSFGTEIDFEVNREKWHVFTTRPDTIYGVTFMVISSQHPKLFDLVTKKQKKEVEKFIKKIKSVSQKSMKDVEELEKEGVFTGSYTVNPLTKEKVPIYAGNFVVADYGSGMVMAVPAHDKRDFDFARKYNLPIKQVIKPKNKKIIGKNKFYNDSGILVNSDRFNGIENHEAKWHITQYLEGKRLGRKTVQYKLKDWLVSRQRYWGTPIPIIYCSKCGAVPVPEKDLPVKLPDKIKFGKGNPLTTNSSWIKTKCPKCGAKARRETDTMDTFVNSSWYFLRYCDPKNNKKIFDSKKVNYWCPIDQYIGGKEHACMHLIYFRFYTKFLRDLGLLNFDEPAKKLFHQGVLKGEDGEKMSKSRGNSVLPETVSDKYGIDTARLFLVSIASPDKDVQWTEKGIKGSLKFINKIFKYFEDVKFSKDSPKLLHKLNYSIKKIENEIKNFKYNLAIINLRSLFDVFYKEKEVSKTSLEKFLKLLHPFCPHITEELWHKLGNKNFISLEKWPVADEKKIDKNLEKHEEMIEKLCSDIEEVKKLIGKKNPEVYVYVLPKEKEIYSGVEGIKLFAVNDKNKYDPENKSKKAKPGKPAIYLE